ncbi:MAG: lasso peptide biosynthesis B2 protein, partial [Bacillota bacterium]
QRAHALPRILLMSLQLRDDLHWCDCQGRAVFLDTRADRYFCLPQTSNDAFVRLAAGTTLDGDEQLLNQLIAKGVLVEAETEAALRRPPAIDAPTHNLVEEPFPPTTPRWMLRALAAELRAASALRARAFHNLIESARCRGQRPVDPSAKDHWKVEEIVAAAAGAALITRSHDRCLVRALAVHALCTRTAVRPKLVLGVIAHPFAAHCWVQLGSAVLVGGFEQARIHTPVLVVG